MKLTWRSIVFSIAIFFLFFTAMSHAQVVGVSEILQSTNANEIDGYSATEIQDADTAYYYDVAVVGYIFQDNAQQDVQTDPDEYGLAAVSPSSSVHQGSEYTVYSDHYLIAYITYSDGTYYNPDQYYNYPGEGFTSNGGDPSGTGYAPGGGYEYTTQQYIYLGYTYVQTSTAPPRISSLNPSSGIQGGSGTIQVQGKTLRDDLGVLTAAFRDNDITVSVASGDANQAALNYNISSNATIGTHQLTLSNTWGDSEPSNFTVGYPPAIVTSVSPPTWVAGNDYSVTVTGTGFGSNPSVSAIASGVFATGASGSSPDGTQTHFNVHVDANAPNEPVQIVVTPGYTGSSYTCGNCNGQSPTGSSNVQVQAISATPTIMRVTNKSDQAACTKGTPTQSGQGETDVFAGEQVLLCVQNPPSGLRIASQTWSVEKQSDITGGFVSTDGMHQPGISVGGHEMGGREADPPATTQQSFSFFFLNITSETVTYNWTLANGGQSSLTADFHVSGPTGNVFTANIQTDDTGTIIKTPTSGTATLTSFNSPTRPTVGIEFNALGRPPAGEVNQSFMWVQILNPLYRSAISSVGSKDPFDNTPAGLDGTYPYSAASSLSTNDTPSIPMPAQYGEWKRFFDATMYLMWDPALPSGCHPATTDSSHPGQYTPIPSECTSTPIPLSSARWKWSGCAINALSSDGSPNWLKHCGAGVSLQPAANGYPTWNIRIPSDNAP